MEIAVLRGRAALLLFSESRSELLLNTRQNPKMPVAQAAEKPVDMSRVQYGVCPQRSGRRQCYEVAQGHVWLTDPWEPSAGGMRGTGQALALEQPRVPQESKV